MGEDFDKLNERELNTLVQSSGDDVDMALVACAVRELRQLRSTALTPAEVEALQFAVLATRAEMIGEAPWHAPATRVHAALGEQALAVLDRLLKGSE